MNQQITVSLAISLYLLPLSVVAQVLVKDEPRHHPVFENDYVRVLDVRINPGDTTLYHIHKLPSAFIHLSDTRVGSQLLNSQPVEGFNTTGTVSYEQFIQPRVHRVWNMDTAHFHVVDIEILTAENTTATAVMQLPALTLMRDEQKARIYSVQLAPAQQIHVNNLVNPVLFFPITGTIAFKDERPVILGMYLYVDKGKTAILHNPGVVEMKGFMFEIK